LWLNLLTDGLLGLGLGMEPADKNVMKRLPRTKNESFFSASLKRYIFWVGLLIGLTALGIGRAYYDPSHAGTWQTMIFTSLAFMQIGQALASRSADVSFFQIGLLSNPTLLAMAVLTFLLQLAAICVPFLDDFRCVAVIHGSCCFV
jgi:Ca2+-transporting ATPase